MLGTLGGHARVGSIATAYSGGRGWHVSVTKPIEANRRDADPMAERSAFAAASMRRSTHVHSNRTSRGTLAATKLKDPPAFAKAAA